MNWTINLAYKLINMGDKLSYLFKEKVIDHKSSLKVQAKEAWRYIKHVLGYLLLLEWFYKILASNILLVYADQTFIFSMFLLLLAFVYLTERCFMLYILL